MEPALTSLVPSQAIRSNTSSQSADAGNVQQQEGSRSNRSRGRRRKKKNQASGASNGAAGTTTASERAAPGSSVAERDGKPTHSSPAPFNQPNAKKKAKRRNRQRNKTNKTVNLKNWWKCHIPREAVDPITLDPLESLPYPPFALVKCEPYEPVVWPFQPPPNADGNDKQGETAEERERRILSEQWGNRLVEQETSQVERSVNLFDGRALAYYMVSQLQFIDPLNRRDVTRDEIVQLDRYLRANSYGKDFNVTEAFDGTVLSTAGATAQTAAGRSRLLQHEASVLLNALFRSGVSASGDVPASTVSAPTATNSDLAMQFEHFDREHGTIARDGTTPSGEVEDTGIYSIDPAFVVIDDDLNPGLRGAHPRDLRADAPRFEPQFPSLGPPPGAATFSPQFPSLSASRLIDESVEEAPKRTLPKAATLSKINNLVKKTDPQERQRQWEAREANLRKAAMSTMRFGMQPAPPPSLAEVPALITPESVEPSDVQIARNKNLADALGIGAAAPSLKLAEGTRNQFEEELTEAVYSESLIKDARDTVRTDFLLRLEKKWKMFVHDKSAVSLSLQSMDRTHRKFVHEYSDHWRFKTESFDPQPRRYVHCSKQLDTRIPSPLLSVVMQQPVKKIVRTSLSLSGAPALSADDAVNTRLSSLDRERPKLELAKRSVPLPEGAMAEEKLGVEQEKAAAIAYRRKIEERAIRERQQKARAQKAIESAFASDDESDAGSLSSSSVWEEQEQAYVESSSEGA